MRNFAENTIPTIILWWWIFIEGNFINHSPFKGGFKMERSSLYWGWNMR